MDCFANHLSNLSGTVYTFVESYTIHALLCCYRHQYGTTVNNFFSFASSIGQSTPHDSGVVPVMEVAADAEVTSQPLGSAHEFVLHCLAWS